MRIRIDKIDANTAESLAIAALSFLVENPEWLARFLAVTGVGPSDLRRIAHERAFLGAVLEHVTGDQEVLAAFSSQVGRDPAVIDHARALLTGGDWERDTA